MMTSKHTNTLSLGHVISSDAFQFHLFNFVMDDKPKKLQQLLCKAGEDINVDVANTRGQTALYVGCLTGRIKCVGILLKHGADTNRRSSDGSTAVHAAAFSCEIALLQIVVQYGGDLRLHDFQGLVPRDWAEEAGIKYNKKVLDYIDMLNDLTTEKLSANQLNMCKEKLVPMQSSLSKSIHLDDFATNGSCVKKSVLHQNGFGDFVTIPFPGSFVAGHAFDVGFLSIVPIIRENQLMITLGDSKRNLLSPPCFILLNGYLGCQAVTIKKLNVSKKKRMKEVYNFSSDLLVSELNILRSLHHPNILLLMGVTVEDWNSMDKTGTNSVPQCFVFEHIKLGSLHFFLHFNHQRLLLNDSLALLLQVLDALTYLNARGFIHCCLSSHAVQLVSIHTAKISDFYYALHKNDVGKTYQQPCSVLNRWIAPELLEEKHCSLESDVYSFCAVATEMISGNLPWNNFDVNSIKYQILSKRKSLSIPECIPSTLSSVLHQGLMISRQKRTITLEHIQSTIKDLVRQENFLQQNNLPKDDGIDVPDAAPDVFASESRQALTSTLFNSPIRQTLLERKNLLNQDVFEDSVGLVSSSTKTHTNKEVNSHQLPFKSGANVSKNENLPVSFNSDQTQTLDQVITPNANETALDGTMQPLDRIENMNLSSGRCEESRNFNDDLPMSPVENEQISLHDSLQSANHSLVKLSEVLKQKHIQQASLLNHKRDEFPDEDCEEEKPMFPTINSILSSSTSCEDNSSMEDNETSFPTVSCSLFDEVISAIGDQQLIACSMEYGGKKEKIKTKKPVCNKVYTSVVEWKNAVRKASDQYDDTSQFKLGSTKKQSLQKHTPSQEKMFGEESLLQPDTNVALKKQHWSTCDGDFDQLFSSLSDDGFCTNNDTALSPLSQALFTESITSNKHSSVIQPSAFHVYHSKANLSFKYDSVPLPEESSKRKYSITSADLEDIFSDFADRSCNNGFDDFDGDVSRTDSSFQSRSDVAVTVTPKNSIERLKNSSKVGNPIIMLSRSSQTVNTCDTGEKMHETCTRNKFVSSHAISPPVLDEFLCRTGNWADLIHEEKNTQFKKEASICEQLADGDKFSILSKRKTLSAPEIHLEVNSSLNRGEANLKPLIRRIKSANHLQKLDAKFSISVCKSIPPPVSENKSNEEFKKSLYLTPSKLSFQSKVSLFEYGIASISTNQKPKKLFCHENTAGLFGSPACSELQNKTCTQEAHDDKSKANVPVLVSPLPSTKITERFADIQNAKAKTSLTDVSNGKAVSFVPLIKISTPSVECPPCDGLINVGLKKQNASSISNLQHDVSTTTVANLVKSEDSSNNCLHRADTKPKDGIGCLASGLVEGTLNSFSACNSQPILLDDFDHHKNNLVLLSPTDNEPIVE